MLVGAGEAAGPHLVIQVWSARPSLCSASRVKATKTSYTILIAFVWEEAAGRGFLGITGTVCCHCRVTRPGTPRSLCASSSEVHVSQRDSDSDEASCAI